MPHSLVYAAWLTKIKSHYHRIFKIQVVSLSGVGLSCLWKEASALDVLVSSRSSAAAIMI